MRAALYEKFREPISIENVPDPSPPDGGVVIRVRACGICRSDWHGWMGHDPDIRLPHVPGHELAGTVESLGESVTKWQRGERVTVPFVCGCGTCSECRSGNQQVCENQFQPGFTAWGSFAQYVAINYADVNLVRIPVAMEFATAASLGCRFVTAFRALADQARVRPGEWVAVHGCGGVGLSAVMIAVALEARVVALDISDDKLDLAGKLGAESVLNAHNAPDLPDAVRSLTGGGAHVSLDALGSQETSYNSVSCLRRRGRHVQIGLMLAENRNSQVPMDRVIAHELEIYGSHGIQAHRYPELLGMIASGRLHPEKLIGKRVSLAQAPAELVAMESFAGTGVTVIDDF